MFFLVWFTFFWAATCLLWTMVEYCTSGSLPVLESYDERIWNWTLISLCISLCNNFCLSNSTIIYSSWFEYSWTITGRTASQPFQTTQMYVNLFTGRIPGKFVVINVWQSCSKQHRQNVINVIIVYIWFSFKNCHCRSFYAGLAV